MPSATNHGGTIHETADASNGAGVIQAKATQTVGGAATWVVTLHGVPRRANYTIGQALTYNARGTHNVNANNALTVTSVNGPAKYTCTGPWPMNT